MSAQPLPDARQAGPLLMLRLLPDMAAFGRWAAATGQRALRDDLGYAVHAALRAALGDAAPKPFAVLQRQGGTQVIGYTSHSAGMLDRALGLACTGDPGAASALGLMQSANATLQAMPERWLAGERLSFEVRVAPVVRSRQARGAGYPEIDAAYHADFAADALGNRESAYERWLARELMRGGAAQLLSHRALAFQLSPIARRNAGRPIGRNGSPAPGRMGRVTHSGLLPDLTVRGQLKVDQPHAFAALLARGLGRHRSFGFGCLLLAPAGAWT